jgi:hypothetical protein
MSHAFGALQHWARHRGSPQNVLSVGWTLVVDAKHGDAEQVTVSARGFDHTATHIVDILNASVLVYPPRRGATVHRGIAVDVTGAPDAQRLSTAAARRPSVRAPSIRPKSRRATSA